MRNYETNVFEYVDKKTNQHIVKAQTMYAGKAVCAVAKCDPNDAFDLKIGTDLALKRLDRKIAYKRAASMRDYVNNCKLNLAWVKAEERRIKKAIEKANIAQADRLVEAKQYEAEIAEIIKNS